MFKLFIAILTLLASPLGHANGGGSLGGNGGGIISCDGRAPVVLDYYEALRSANGNAEEVLDPDQMPESEFFKIIIERIKLSETRKKNVWIIESYGGTSLADKFIAIQKKLGPVSSWAIGANSRVYDENILYDLPSNCVFEQAAITRDFVTQNIAGNASRLSPGQQRILEVHEIIYAAIMSRVWREFIMTSTGARDYVKTLLKKKVTYSELRLAYYRMYNPTDTFTWEKKDIRRVSNGWSTNALSQNAGPWFLDLRNGVQDPKCAHIIIVVPIDSKQSFLYRYQYSKVTSPNLSMSVTSSNWSDLIGKCDYLDAIDIYRNGLYSYVQLGPPSIMNRIVSKIVMQYMEEKLNSTASEYDPLIDRIANDLGWK